MNPKTELPATDPYDLERFVAAQADCYGQVLDGRTELSQRDDAAAGAGDTGHPDGLARR